MKKNDPSPSQLFDEFVKTLHPYGDPRDAEIAALRQQLAAVTKERDELLAAAENLIRVKGRHHTEQAYKQLESAIAKVKP